MKPRSCSGGGKGEHITPPLDARCLWLVAIVEGQSKPNTIGHLSFLVTPDITGIVWALPVDLSRETKKAFSGLSQGFLDSGEGRVKYMMRRPQGGCAKSLLRTTPTQLC